MNQGLTILISALIVGVLAIAILSAYTSSTASKLPEQSEMVQIFLSGAIVGSGISWVVTSGILHGSSVMNMISSDISSIVKDVGLKGGDEVLDMSKVNSSVDIKKTGTNDMAAMLGGFLKSVGLDNKVLKELNVGMPSF
jgi:hypothetical protein